jgi:hypothetical protein
VAGSSPCGLLSIACGCVSDWTLKKTLTLQLLVYMWNYLECHKVGGDGTMICQNNGMLEHWGVGLTEYSRKTINIGRKKHSSKNFSDFNTINIVSRSVCNNSRGFTVPFCKTDQYKNSFFVKTTLDWLEPSEWLFC